VTWSILNAWLCERCCYRDGLEWLKCLVSLIQKLLTSHAWKEVMHKQLSDCIHQLKQVSLRGILCSFLLALFFIISDNKYVNNTTEISAGDSDVS